MAYPAGAGGWRDTGQMSAAPGIAASLAVVSEMDSCQRFCTEVLRVARHWGPAEQRVLHEQLPLVLLRLYSWFSLNGQGISEALLRAFHPSGELSVHLLSAPAFVFPLHRLPARALRAAVLAAAGSTGTWATQREAAGRGRPQDLTGHLGSGWFDLLGLARVARSPAGEIEGIMLTAQEFTFTCLIHYLVCEQLPVPMLGRGGGGFGGFGSFGGFGGGAAGGFGGAPGSLGGGAPGFAGGASGLGGAGGMGMGLRFRPNARMLGNICITFERLLLAHLQEHLRHAPENAPYEPASAHEPHASRFLLRLIHEFLVAPQPLAEALPVSLWRVNSVRQDVRSRPASLHASRLIAIHILSNPALRSGCEESSASTSSVTREVALLVPAFADMIVELLSGVASQKQFTLESLTSLMRLWLVILMPWKAKRLYAWYLETRPAQPQLEHSSFGGAAVVQYVIARGATPHQQGNKILDINLLGLEPDAPMPQGSYRQGPPWVDKAFAPPLGPERMVASVQTRSIELPLVPGNGNAVSWAGYVARFPNAYGLLEAFLEAPAHRELCLELCRRLSRPRSSAALGAAGGGGSTLGAIAHVVEDEIELRFPHIISALKTLAQALLCFTDIDLLRVLEERRGSTLSSPAVPLLTPDGKHIRPQVVLDVSLTWAALLSAHRDHRDWHRELEPLLGAVSRQIEHTPLWSQHRLPLLNRETPPDPSEHQTFAQQLLAQLGASTTAQAGPVREQPMPEFVGSEWQRPKRGSEVEALLFFTYWLALAIDWLLGLEFRDTTACGQAIPRTEWPRMFASWKLVGTVITALLLAVFW